MFDVLLKIKIRLPTTPQGKHLGARQHEAISGEGPLVHGQNHDSPTPLKFLKFERWKRFFMIGPPFRQFYGIWLTDNNYSIGIFTHLTST